MIQNRLLKWWEQYRFQSILFITGAAVLIVEVAATRIISPYYGNTIYTVSSVIGVTLGALSLGYYRGGKEGTQVKGLGQFYGVVLDGGKSLVVLMFFTIMVLPYGSYFFSLRSGPIIWSIILFFLPSYFLGKLSPIAVGLATKDSHVSASAVVGSLFFWSTCGSIVGAIGTGFILIPYFGIKSILFMVALIVVLIGSFGSMANSDTQSKERKMVDLIFLLAIAMIIYGFGIFYRTNGALAVTDGVYEQLTVMDRVLNGRTVRLLFQDRTTSSGMFLDGNASESVFPYADYLRLHRLTMSEPERALFIGAGAYTLPKQLHHEYPKARIDVVDIEPDIEALAEQYFQLPITAQIRTYIEDGRMFLTNSSSSYDVIFSDVYYTMNSVPAHVTTREFLEIAKSHLSERGLFLANIIGSNYEFPQSMLYAEIHTMHKVFPFVSVFPVESATSTRLQNFILVGSTVPLRQARDVYSVSPPQSDVVLRHFSQNDRVENVNYRNYPILTDNYAPTEYMAAKLMRLFYDRKLE